MRVLLWMMGTAFIIMWLLGLLFHIPGIFVWALLLLGVAGVSLGFFAPAEM